MSFMSLHWVFGLFIAVMTFPFRVAEAEHAVFLDQTNSIRFQYSDELSIEPVNLEAVVVALKHRTKGFPSFNIVSIAEFYDPQALSAEDYQERILSDYRKIGYTDAVAKNTTSITINKRSVFTTEVKYETPSGKLVSLVTLLPNGPESHLVLTYIDRQLGPRDTTPEYSEIIGSFQLIDRMEPSPSTDIIQRETEGWLIYWTTLAILAGLGVGGGLAMRIRRAKSTKP